MKSLRMSPVLQQSISSTLDDRSSLLQSILACGKQPDLLRARALHALSLGNGFFPHDACIGNALLSLYFKCRAVEEARNLFQRISARTVVSWSALIDGYVRSGLCDQALHCFGLMRFGGFPPNAITFSSVLRACGSEQALDMGEEIHAEIQKQGLLQGNLVLGTSLLAMYARCNALAKAQEVFDNLPSRDVVSWNALISGYVQQGFCDKALNVFQHMQDEGIPANETTFSCLLKACGALEYLEMGEHIHAEVKKRGLMGKNITLNNAILDMYAKCQMLGKAEDVFNELPVRDVVTWNSIISGYSRHGLYEGAISHFIRMREEGVLPDSVTFICTLSACARLGDIKMGEKLHAEIMTLGLLQNDVFLGVTLVDMYAKCNMMIKAQEVFDQLHVWNAATWNALISGYANHGLGREALNYFEKMHDKASPPNSITYLCSLKACASLGFLEMGEKVHAEVTKQGLLEKDCVLGAAIINMYAKCRMLEKAEEVFKILPTRNIVCWDAMIAGYSEHGMLAEVLNCIMQMKDEGIFPEVSTFGCILQACGRFGCLEIGEEIHAEVQKHNLLANDIVLGTALLDMYCKCGALEKVREVFDELPIKNLSCWTALMTGYAELGNVRKVLGILNMMIAEEILPDSVTFLVILTACSHGGLLDEGQRVFEIMGPVYSLTPTTEHYACMVDLFGRAEHIEKAMILTEKVPYSQRLQLWLSIINSCSKCANVKLGRLAFEQSLQLDQKCTSAYLGMRKIYATADMCMEASNVYKWGGVVNGA